MPTVCNNFISVSLVGQQPLSAIEPTGVALPILNCPMVSVLFLVCNTVMDQSVQHVERYSGELDGLDVVPPAFTTPSTIEPLYEFFRSELCCIRFINMATVIIFHCSKNVLITLCIKMF